MPEAFEALHDADISTDTFSFYTSVSSVFSSTEIRRKSMVCAERKNYYQQHQTYYTNLRVLGMEYSILNYQKALPFLLMLPQSVCGQ